MISILEFCKLNAINVQPIDITVENGKKTFGKTFINKEGKTISYQKITVGNNSWKPNMQDYTGGDDGLKITKLELKKRATGFSQYDYCAIDTMDISQIDVDDKQYMDKIEDLLKTHPYYLSAGKGLPHIFYKRTQEYPLMRTGTMHQSSNGSNGIELLTGQWGFAHKDIMVYNGDKEIPVLDTSFLGTNNSIKTETKTKIIKIKKSSDVKVGVVQPVQKTPKKSTDESAFRELCKKLSIKRLGNYDSWLECMFLIKNELGESGYELLDEISKLASNYDASKNKDIWDSTEQRTEGSRKTIKHLKEWVKMDNPEDVSSNITADIRNTFSMCEKDIAEYVIKHYLKGCYSCADVERKTIYYFNGVRWIEDMNNISLFHIITDKLVIEYETLLSSLSQDKDEDKAEKKVLNSIIKKLKGKTTYWGEIIKWICYELYDNTFLSKIDENPDLLGFENGVYDLMKKEFRAGKPDDYVGKSTGYDYPEVGVDNGYTSKIEDFLLKVYPDAEVRKYNLQQDAMALSGRKYKDLIHTHTGRGGNGKSIKIDVIKHSFGQYYANIPVKMITLGGNTGGHTQADPFLSKLKGIRYGASSEPQDGAKANDSFMKMVGSQEEQEYRLLFSNIINTLTLQMKLHIFCNDKIKLKGDDGGLGRRMKVVPYPSVFTEMKQDDPKNNRYKIDYTLTDEVKNWRKDYMRMMLDLYKYDYKYECPKKIEELSQQYMDDNNEILTFVREHIEQTNNEKDYVLLSDLKDLYKNNKENDQSKAKTLKENLQKVLNATLRDTSVKIDGKFKKCKNVLFGWRYIKEEEGEVEVDITLVEGHY